MSVAKAVKAFNEETVGMKNRWVHCAFAAAGSCQHKKLLSPSFHDKKKAARQPSDAEKDCEKFLKDLPNADGLKWICSACRQAIPRLVRAKQRRHMQPSPIRETRSQTSTESKRTTKLTFEKLPWLQTSSVDLVPPFTMMSLPAVQWDPEALGVTPPSPTDDCEQNIKRGIVCPPTCESGVECDNHQISTSIGFQKTFLEVRMSSMGRALYTKKDLPEKDFICHVRIPF
jgi:hypothetical protein